MGRAVPELTLPTRAYLGLGAEGRGNRTGVTKGKSSIVSLGIT